MLQEKLHALSPNDPQEKGQFLSRILSLKNYPENSLTVSQHSINTREEARSVWLTFPLDFSEDSTISILQKTTEHKLSSPTSICSNSLTELFPHDTDKSEGSVFFPKTNVKQISDKIKKLSLPNKKGGLPTLGRNPMVHALGCQKERKAEKGGDTRWQ